MTDQRRSRGLPGWVRPVLARALGAARAITVPIADAWLVRALPAAERRGRDRTRDLSRRADRQRRSIRFVLLNAWSVGGAIRATYTTAGHLNSKHDVEIVSVVRSTVEPGMPIPEGLRMRALFDAATARPGPRTLAALLLYRTPSRLWHPRDAQVKRASLWTDVLLMRWLRAVPDGTIVVTTRPALTILASRLAPAGAIVIAQEHQRVSVYHAELRQALVTAMRNVSLLVTLTESHRADWQELLGEDGPPVVAIPNAVPAVPLGPGDPSAHKLIAAGRLENQKGFDLLLAAFAAGAARHPDWTLDVYGNGSRREDLQRSILDLGLEGRVHLKGPTDRLGERMREASVFVLSSRYEGFPIVLLEAMAAGLAVVSFDCPTGPRDIVADGANGILVPAEDVAAIATALDRVMEDEALRRRLAAAAPAAVEPYSVRAVGRRWDELLAGRPDGRTVAGIDRPPAR